MDELKQVLREYLESTCKHLSAVRVPQRQWIRVHRESKGQVSFPIELRPSFDDALFYVRFSSEDSRKPFIGRIADLLRRDVKLREIVMVDAAGKPVDLRNTGWWVENMFLMPFVYAYVRRFRLMNFDEVNFEALFEELKQSMTSQTVDVISSSPLINVAMDADRLEVEPGLVIRRLRDEEIEEWLNADRLLSMHPLSAMEMVDLEGCVEVAYSQGRFDPIGGSVVEEEKVSRLLTALRLYSDGSPRIAFTTTRRARIFGLGGGTHWSLGVHRLGETCSISDSDTTPVRSLYEKLGRCPNRDLLDLALRRWNAMADRLSDEDRLIDSWIALESLFTPDETRELKFRASLRIASFLGATATERISIYETVKDSYDLRSEIVHGETRRKKLLRSDLALITKQTRLYLRRSLMSIIDLETDFKAASIEQRLLDDH